MSKFCYAIWQIRAKVPRKHWEQYFKHNKCHGLNVHVFPNSYVEILTPNKMVLISGAFGVDEVIKVEPPSKGLMPLFKKKKFPMAQR